MIKQNLDNLTSLWETAGTAMSSFNKTEEYSSSIVNISEWPNRIWFNKEITEENLQTILEVMEKSEVKLTLPYWDIYNSNFIATFANQNLKLKFKQVGMSIKLERKFDLGNTLYIKEVNDDEERIIWEKIYPLAFGYKISKDIILNTGDKIKYFIAYSNNEAVGTAIVFNTDNIAGIHGVGVIPSARRKGFAEEIMKYVLNYAIDENMKYSTLQASDMGKGIYLKLGYSEDFQIYNYIL